MINKKETSN